MTTEQINKAIREEAERRWPGPEDYWQERREIFAEGAKFSKKEISLSTEDYTKEVAVAFSIWVEGLSAVQRCTVWPPVGSGSGTGLYERTNDDLFNEWYNKYIGLTITSKPEHGEQNENERLNNSDGTGRSKLSEVYDLIELHACKQKIIDAFNAGRNRLPMAWDGASEPMYDSAEEYLNYINQ